MQLTLEKRLRQIAREKSADDLVRIYEAVKSDMRKHLPSITENFPHYSRHDIPHIESILDSIERILGNERIKKLTIGDIWLILISAYLHEIGMLISCEEEKAAWESDAFKKFLKSCEQVEDNELKKAALAAQGKEPIINPLLMKKHVTLLTAEFFRRNHTERSKKIIAGNSPVSKLFSFDIPEELQNVWECAGNIVALHGRNFNDILKEAPFHNFPIPHCGDYHPRFVAVLLRLGDLCDVKRGRFNNMSLEQFGLLPDISAQHFYKHETMKDTQISKESISLTAKIDFAAIKHELLNEKRLSETEQEDFCQKVVYQHVNWFNMLDSELANFKRYRGDILPAGMENDIPQFVPKIIVNTEEVTLSLEDLRFNFSREKAFELIEGYSLYDDPLTFIRELIQNSLDALKQQMWFDLNTENSWFEGLIPPNKRTCKDTLSPFDFTDGHDALASLQKLYSHYRIDISVKYDQDKKTAEITFEDNGIGITREDIKNKILQTGASWHGHTYQEQLTAMPAWLRPTGSFGIGLHSVFAVTDHFRIETKSQKEPQEPKGNIIVLHSGQGNGFVFSRPDETTIKRNGTRVILEVALDKIPDVEIHASPYETPMDNPVLEVLCEYIKSNVICPLFDVYVYDGNVPDKERDNQPPLVAKLCDHAVYGKLFNSVIRNCMLEGTRLSLPDIMKGYDIAISNYRPLRFIIWDQKRQTFYEIEPVIGKHFYINEEEQNQGITYMGILLREQKINDLSVIDYLLVWRVEILAGNGKADITANRNKLKREKATSLSGQLKEAVKIVAWFGRELFSMVVQADSTQRFLIQAEKDAVKMLQYDGTISGHLTGLECIFPDKNPSLVDQVLYIVFVFRSFIRKNHDAFQKSLECIFFSTDYSHESAVGSYQQFVHIWCNDRFLNPFIRWLLKMSFELVNTFDNTGEYGRNSMFGQQFAGAFSNGINEEFCYDLPYINIEELGNVFGNEFANVFGSEFGYDFCSQFGYGFGYGLRTSSGIIGHAFGANDEHVYGLYDTLNTSLCGELHLIGEDFIDDLIASSSDIYIDLLANDNWAWILRLSNREDSSTRLFLEKTSNYFIRLTGFNNGYGFDGCNTVIDIFCADKLTGPLSVLHRKFYEKFPFLQNMSLTQIQQHGEEFIVTLERDDPHHHVFVSVDNDIILKWLKAKEWIDSEEYCLLPCFTSYANLGIDMGMDYILFLYNNVITIPSGTPALIFPEHINGASLEEIIGVADNVEAAVAGIMACDQVKNIVDYIWRCRMQEGITFSKEQIHSEYERLMRDYVDALWEEVKTGYE